MNKKVIIGVGTLFFVVVIVVIVGVINQNKFYNKFQEIGYSEVLSKDGEYYVYYYDKNCSNCDNIKKDMEKFNKSNIVYLVDMSDGKNQNAWYDWKEHHAKYDVKIGEVNELGENIFFEGESIEKYLGRDIKNSQDNFIDYTIEIANSKFVDEHSNANIGDIYAVDNTAIYNRTATNVEDITIIGTPTIIKVNDGEVIEYMLGDEVYKLFE